MAIFNSYVKLPEGTGDLLLLRGALEMASSLLQPLA